MCCYIYEERGNVAEGKTEQRGDGRESTLWEGKEEGTSHLFNMKEACDIPLRPACWILLGRLYHAAVVVS